MPHRGATSTSERVRFIVGSRATQAVVACLLLAAVGGFVAVQSFTGPDTTTERRTVGTWTTDSEFRHGAVVQSDTRAFESGTVLRNRSVYFTSVAPRLNGTYVFTHAGDADPATVRTNLRLVVRAVEPGDPDGVLWRVSGPVASDRTESLEPGEQLTVPYELNVTAQSQLAERVRRELGSARGQVQVRLVADTTVSAAVAGERFERERSESLLVTPRADSYGVAAATDGEHSEQVRETVEVPVEPDPARRYGGLAALVVGLLGAAAVVYLDRTGRLDLDDETRAELRVARERGAFDEWISTGRLPPAGDDRIVTVDSLEDLVDVAIDSQRRVIEDADAGTFAVLDDSTRYEFRPSGTDRLRNPGGPSGDEAASRGDEAPGPFAPDASTDGDGRGPRSSGERGDASATGEE